MSSITGSEGRWFTQIGGKPASRAGRVIASVKSRAHLEMNMRLHIRHIHREGGTAPAVFIRDRGTDSTG